MLEQQAVAAMMGYREEPGDLTRVTASLSYRETDELLTEIARVVDAMPLDDLANCRARDIDVEYAISAVAGTGHAGEALARLRRHS